MIRKLNKTFEKEFRLRSNSKPAKGAPLLHNGHNDRYSNHSANKGTPILIQKAKVHTGSTRMETPDSARKAGTFSETPVHSSGKKFNFSSGHNSSPMAN